jgi:hypothetical protein
MAQHEDTKNTFEFRRCVVECALLLWGVLVGVWTERADLVEKNDDSSSELEVW